MLPPETIPFAPQEEEVACACRGVLHPQAIVGMDLFNAGQYFDAHEALELAWREERGVVRELYRGILQVAVAYYHIARGNLVGAQKMLRRSRAWLGPFPETCRGVQVGQLRRDAILVELAIQDLHAEELAGFDRSLLKPIAYEYGVEE